MEATSALPALAASPWVLTGAGRAVDLLTPTAGSIDLDVDVAEALARLPRFNGHVRSGAYSVAQHCVIGADLLARDADADLAAAFLLHDAHEAYVGDIATPVQMALARAAAAAGTRAGLNVEVGSYVLMGIADLKARLDQAIHAAAGLRWPLTPTQHARVKAMDGAMLTHEARRLLPAPPRAGGFPPIAIPLRLGEKLTPWPWPRAADEYRDRLARYCPRRARRAA